MDGVSSAAAVIQLLGITGACGQKLYRITKHTPTKIIAISNEINDISLVLSNMENLMVLEQNSSWSNTSGTADPPVNVSIDRSVTNVKAKLVNLRMPLLRELCSSLTKVGLIGLFLRAKIFLSA